MNEFNEDLKHLELIIKNHGWYSRQLKLEISLTGEFEGFYGKASETWEHQVVIKITGKQPMIIPEIEVIGKRHENIDDVAKRVINIISRHQNGLL